MKKLRYGNTNTFYIPGTNGGLLIDTDMAGTMPLFFRAIKAGGVETGGIAYVLATHYHPDHCGLIGKLQGLGVKLLLMDVQKPYVHSADGIFAREKHTDFVPVKEEAACVIGCAQSRSFLQGLCIEGEIFPTPSHSADSVSLLLDNGDCFVGDLEPLEYLEAYEGGNPALQDDWRRILRRHPGRVFYAHANEKLFWQKKNASPL